MPSAAPPLHCVCHSQHQRLGQPICLINGGWRWRQSEKEMINKMLHFLLNSTYEVFFFFCDFQLEMMQKARQHWLCAVFYCKQSEILVFGSAEWDRRLINSLQEEDLNCLHCWVHQEVLGKPMISDFIVFFFPYSCGSYLRWSADAAVSSGFTQYIFFDYSKWLF